VRIRGISLAVTAGFLAAAPSLAQEPVRIAQAVAQDEDDSAGEAAEAPGPEMEAPRIDVETIVIYGESSAAAQDYGTADSVTAFDAADLEALGAQSVADLDSFTPSLEIVTSGATTPTFFIRGIGLNDFASNSTGAVAIYQDDVAINAPALQLGTIFDVEAVTILRGPQGSGPNRNASAGSIKLYSRKPSGEFGGYLRSDFGNFASRDFEGAIEFPIYKDLFATRLAFRYTQRDPYADNGCGNLPPFEDRPRRMGFGPPNLAYDPETGTGWSLCGESVFPPSGNFSQVPPGLPDKVNDRKNWAARGQLLFQPTLDMTWLANVHGSRRDENSNLGQAIGVRGQVRIPEGCNPNTDPNCVIQNGILGGADGEGYRDRDIFEMLGTEPGGFPPPSSARQLAVAQELADNLDIDPWRGDYDRVGQTKNDTLGGFLRGEILLPGEVNFTTISGYDSYDRTIDQDLDQSPNVLFEILTDDEGWQFTQDLRFDAELDHLPLRWNAGGFYLMESLDVTIENNLGGAAGLRGVSDRAYTQDLWSFGVYGGLEWDFWDDYTLDGGFRWNWETKAIDYALIQANTSPVTADLRETWDAPSGFIRLTYRFREDTHAYLKYTRGWKSGTFNATASPQEVVSLALPETNDAFEIGLRGSWFDGRLGLDLSLFYMGYDQYQIFTVQNDFGVPPEFVILNANEAEVYGSEIDLVGRPWEGGLVNVRFGWLESQFLDFTQVQLVQRQVGLNSVVEPLEINNTGNQLLNSPRFKVSITAEHTLELGRWGSLIPRYDGAWSDTTYFDATEGRGGPNIDRELFLPENTIAQIPYWLHNVRLSYRTPRGDIEIAGWVRNVANQAYKTFAFNASGAPFFTTIYYVGEPRTYGLSVVVNF
jgi:iron complex outermembrane receptor protein